MINFKTIFENFNCEGKFVKAEKYGEGHINETYAVYVENAKVKRYILQKINHNLFKNVPALMNNIRLVTEFNEKEVKKRGGNVSRECLSLIYTKDGNSFYTDNENYFRMYVFIEDATSHQIAQPELFYESAVAFGGFAKMLEKFDANLLYDVLPNFHNTRVRYNNFLNSLKKDESKRAKEVSAEIDFVIKREKYVDLIVNMLSSGKIPTRVTHNDTKLNNVMIDNATGKALAVIDFDTIMKGSILYDFGDSIRFGCNSSFEDEKDLSKVNFRLDLFEAYTKGYLSAIGTSITKTEKENLPLASLMMTLECGMRFLSDHLDGDKYFRIHRENHNLDRARTQFKLVSDMEKVMDKMASIITNYK